MAEVTLQDTPAENNEALPEGWALTLMDVAGKWLTGGTPSRKISEYFDGGIPWVKSGDLKDGRIKKTEETISDAGLANSATRLLPRGALCVALYGATIGKLGILDLAAATNQACASCIVDPAVASTKFLFYYVLQQRQRLVEAGQGGTQPNLTNQIVREWPLPLPPLREQERIVAQVDDLLDHINAARDHLFRVPAILEHFRQAVLAAACSGRLTEDWREYHSDCGTGGELLARVRKERRTNWADHKKANEDAYPVPQPLDMIELPEIPEKWTWTSLDEVVQEGRPIIYGIIKPGPHVAGGIPYVRVTEMEDGKTIDPTRLRRASPERAAKFSRAMLAAGDVLVSKDGTIGRVSVVPPQLIGGNITQHLVRAAIHQFLDIWYAVAAIRSPYSQRWLVGELKGVALQGVNVRDFRRLPIPLPPLDEQREIVQRLGRLFALTDAIEKRAKDATLRADKLTQSILAKSFRGELVPTEAEVARREGREYEPATVLLERIRERRKSDIFTKSNGKTKRPKMKRERAKV